VEVRSNAKNIYLRCLRHSLLTKVTIDLNSLIAVAETNSSIEILEVIRVKISVIISGGDSIAVGNAR
jgi:UDP-N-acetylglucosamine enolpyruvyl transferase